MKSFQRKITVIALTMLFSNMASATAINGKVADAVTGEAIIGASVIYNNKVGAVTDVEGRFHLDIASFPSDISVSYVGYESLRVKIGERDSIVNIRLHEDAQTLNEVVVVGYGTSITREAIPTSRLMRWEQEPTGRMPYCALQPATLIILPSAVVTIKRDSC